MIRAAEPLEARDFAPTQTSNPSGESAFPRPLRKVILAETRERFALAGWQGVSPRYPFTLRSRPKSSAKSL